MQLLSPFLSVPSFSLGTKRSGKLHIYSLVSRGEILQKEKLCASRAISGWGREYIAFPACLGLLWGAAAAGRGLAVIIISAIYVNNHYCPEDEAEIHSVNSAVLDLGF